MSNGSAAHRNLLEDFPTVDLGASHGLLAHREENCPTLVTSSGSATSYGLIEASRSLSNDEKADRPVPALIDCTSASHGLVEQPPLVGLEASPG